jgi:hypothetical protein
MDVLEWRGRHGVPNLLPARALGARCYAESAGYVCTRLAVHTGRHAAGDFTEIVAVWGDPR